MKFDGFKSFMWLVGLSWRGQREAFLGISWMAI